MVRPQPPPADEDQDLGEELRDDPELAAHYEDLSRVNDAIIRAHEVLAAPNDDLEADDQQRS